MESTTGQIRGYCSQCGAKCGTVAEVKEGKLVSVRADKDHPNRGFCVKGEAAPEFVYSPKRIKYPMKRTNPKTSADPGWVRIGWDEALAETARRMSALKAESGAESIAFSRPAPGGSHAGDWAPWLIRLANAFGSPNLITTTHICQWGRDNCSAYTYGVGMPTPHFEEAETILIWGHNPAVSNVQNWRRIKEGLRKGAHLMVVDPRRTATAAAAQQWIPLRPGTDSALLLGVIGTLIRENRYDHEFVKSWSNGPFLVDADTGRFLRGNELEGENRERANSEQYVVWDRSSQAPRAVDTAVHPDRWGLDPELRVEREVKLADGRSVFTRSAFQLLWERVSGFTLDRVSDIVGVPPEQLEAFARTIGSRWPLCYYTFNGIEQHINTAQTNRAMCILYCLTGCFDAPGGNVAFAHVPSNRVMGLDLLDPSQLAKRVGLAQRPLGATRVSAQAYNVYRAALEGEPYPIRGLVTFGANVLLQNADSGQGRAALEKLDFHLHVDMFENPSSQFADILLPAATCWESPALATSFEGGPATASYVQYRQPVIDPIYESRPDMAIIFDLAVRLGLGDQFWGGDTDEGFRYQLSPSGISLEDLKEHPEGQFVPVANQYRKFAVQDADGRARGFDTPSRRIEIYSEPFLEHGYDPLPDYTHPLWDTPDGAGQPLNNQLILTSAKITQFCHSQGRGIPMLRRQAPEPFVEVHPETAGQLGIGAGEMVFIATPRGRIKIRVRITDHVRPGVVATQTGWWEGCDELGLPGLDPYSSEGANVCLIMGNESLDPISGSIPVKSYPCTIHRADQTIVPDLI